MLIIEKNKLYEEIKKEKKKILILKDIVLSISMILSVSVIFVGCFDVLNNIFILFFSISIFLNILTLFIGRTNINKRKKIKENLELKFNEIYEPNNFEKVSEEIILLDQNNNINLINENLIEEIINHKKEIEIKKSRLEILKKNSQEIENT